MFARKDKLILFLCLFFLSGAGGLIYEITWSRLLVFVLGGSTFAITTVLSCFMGGLALGSLVAARFSGRLRNPARTYGWLEIGVGAYCVLVPWLFDLATPLYRGLVALTGESPLPLTVARVLISGLILLVPTCMMGATLPILVQGFVRGGDDLGRRVAALYGLNTIGAFSGCVAAGFFLVPAVGLRGTIWIAAAINLLVGVVALFSSRRAAPGSDPLARLPRPDVTSHRGPEVSATNLLLLYGLSGFAAMAYQVAWTRALILSMGSSTYAFSTIVSSYILGLAGGSLIVSAAETSRAVRDRLGRHTLWVSGLLQAVIALSALFVAPLFGRMPGWVARLTGAGDATFAGILLTEFSIVLALLAVPTLCMGALLPLVTRLYVQGPTAGRGVGHVYAANTLGAIAGALAAGFVLIPLGSVGMQRTIVIASLVSATIGSVWLLAARRGVLSWAPVVVLWLLSLTGATLTEPWSRAVMVSGPYMAGQNASSSVLYYRDGVDTTVAVTSTGGTDRTLRVNGKPDASNLYADMVTQVMLGQLPMLLNPDAEHVLVIGLGAGVTAGAILSHPVTEVEVAEISGAVIEAASFFTEVNNGILSDPRSTILRADGRNHLLLTDRKYDVISVEPSNPWISGVANLFTREFFALARDRLREGGVYCHWIQGYSIRAEDFAAVLNTLNDVFPHTQLWEGGFGDYLAIGSEMPIPIDLDRIYFAMSRPAVAASLAPALIQDPLQLAQHWIADRPALERWTVSRPVLSDDRPYLEFTAPRSLLGTDESGVREALIAHTGRPELPADGPGELNEKFLQAVDRNRLRLEAIRQFEAASAERDAALALDAMTDLAQAGATDGRAMMRVAELANTVESTSEGNVAGRATTRVEELRASLPQFEAFQKLENGEPGIPPWPFSRRFPHEGDPRVQRLEQEIRQSVMARDDERVLQQALELLRRAPDAWRALATVGALRLDREGALAARSQLLEAWIRNPASRSVGLRLAQVYAQLGRHDLALGYLRRAVENGLPHDRTSLAADPLLAPLRAEPEFLEFLEQIAN